MPGPAVEQDSLKSVPWILSRADDARVERASLRKIAQGLKEERLELLLPLGDLLGRPGRGNLATAAGEEFRNLAFQKVLEHRW